MIKFLKSIGVALALGLTTISASLGAEGVFTRTVEANFQDVRQGLADAVVNRGYKIDYEAYVGDMLSRTASDVGAAKAIYKDAQFIQFCSAVLSRDAMEADPGNIATCPYVLFVYERADEPGKVIVGFRRLPETGNDASKAALAKINGVLEEIVNEASEDW